MSDQPIRDQKSVKFAAAVSTPTEGETWAGWEEYQGVLMRFKVAPPHQKVGGFEVGRIYGTGPDEESP